MDGPVFEVCNERFQTLMEYYVNFMTAIDTLTLICPIMDYADEEVNWEYVRCLPDGETVSVDGTHLGHNLVSFLVLG